jgi:hypothetical protein
MEVAIVVKQPPCDQFLPVQPNGCMVDGTSLAGGFRKEEGAGVAAAFVFDQAGMADESGFEGHGQPGLTQG